MGRTMLLVDSTKFDQKRLEVFCPLARRAGIVTDAAPANKLAEAIGRLGTTLKIAT
jgi:DeoR/GlpR family transcriptional regulator of sugar metabolism